VSLLLLNIALVVVVAVLAMRVRTLSHSLAAAGGDPKVLERLSASEHELGAALRRIEHLGGRLDRFGEQTQRCLQQIGLVRYDAFKELGGHLSFSLALMDSRRDGVVLSVLNDREGARAYAKPVSGGRSTFTLSEEEQRAIAGT
jgi:hypothetical protein